MNTEKPVKGRQWRGRKEGRFLTLRGSGMKEKSRKKRLQ